MQRLALLEQIPRSARRRVRPRHDVSVRSRL
jgi:hypothetical protein